MKYNEPKIKITRSFSRKLNIGNFENIDLMSSYTEALFDDDYTEAQIESLSKILYEKAKRDVENAAVEFGNERVKKAEKKSEQEDEAEMQIGLQLELEDEEDRSKKLKEANEAFGLK